MKRTFELSGAGPTRRGRVALILVMVVAALIQLAAMPAALETSTPRRVVAERAAFDAPKADRWFARADEESGLALIAATYNVLQDMFFRPLDSRILLGAAWDGAGRALSADRRAPSGVGRPSLTGDREGDLAEFSTQYRALLAAAGPQVDGVRIAMMAADAMTDSVGEQHTAFLTPDQYERFKAGLTGDSGRVGLGIAIEGQRAPFTINDVIPGTPASLAGIQPGDQIAAVDGRDVSRLELRELSDALRGDEGQPVTLTLRRGSQTVDVTAVRARFNDPALRMQILPEGVCYFRLSTFPPPFVRGPSGLTVDKELDAGLEQCESAGAQGWIMDLRGNGGGSTLALSQVLGRFMDPSPDPISVDRDRVGGRYESATDGHLFRVQRPLIVLVDGGSASASEGFASAIQEYKRGVLVGQRTAGALNAANILALPLDAGISIAIREVFSGRQEVPIDGVGVSPDVALGREASGAIPRQAIDLALRPPPGVGPLAAPPPPPAGAQLSEAELRTLLEPIQIRAEDAADPEERIIPGDLVVDHLNYYASDTPDLQAGRDRGLRLGWRGGLLRWLGRGFPPPFAVDIEVYRDADGADRDFREIYDPGEPRNPPQYRDVEPPIRLGDDIRALIGTGQNEGRVWIAWRRNNLNLVVSRNLTPGQAPNFDELVRLARIVDARAAQAGM